MNRTPKARGKARHNKNHQRERDKGVTSINLMESGEACNVVM